MPSLMSQTDRMSYLRTLWVSPDYVRFSPLELKSSTEVAAAHRELLDAAKRATGDWRSDHSRSRTWCTEGMARTATQEAQHRLSASTAELEATVASLTQHFQGPTPVAAQSFNVRLPDGQLGTVTTSRRGGFAHRFQSPHLPILLSRLRRNQLPITQPVATETIDTIRS